MSLVLERHRLYSDYFPEVTLCFLLPPYLPLPDAVRTDSDVRWPGVDGLLHLTKSYPNHCACSAYCGSYCLCMELVHGWQFGQFAISQTEKVDEMIRERNIKKVFGDTPIAELRELCDEDYEDSRCACFVKPVVADLDERLGKSGIRKLRNDKDKRLEEIKTSMYNQRKDIRACLARKKGVQMLRWFEEIIDPSVAENN